MARVALTMPVRGDRGAARQAGLGEDVLDVVLDRGHGDDEARGDLGVHMAGRDQRRDLALARRQRRYLKAASAHVTFGLWQGASIDDPSGRLESSGSVMAHAKLRSPADVDEALFAEWLRQALVLAEHAPTGAGRRNPRAIDKARGGVSFDARVREMAARP